MTTPHQQQRRHVIMFQKRFANAVRAGIKCQTIRMIRKRRIHYGDLLDLRIWDGTPYRSPHVKLTLGRALYPIDISISSREIWVDGKKLGRIVHLPLAIGDGFETATDLFKWFAEHHDLPNLPFNGELIRWEPITTMNAKGDSQSPAKNL